MTGFVLQWVPISTCQPDYGAFLLWTLPGWEAFLRIHQKMLRAIGIVTRGAAEAFRQSGAAFGTN